MRILLAPDSLKGSLTAPAACRAMEQGCRAALGATGVEYISVPLADGGEGTVEALLQGSGGASRTCTVRGPLGEAVQAQWGLLLDGTGVIEMAQASGLTLVPPQNRRAGVASSYGTGQLIAAAIDAGCRKLLVGVGGSATTDGGAGALEALGVRFTDERGEPLAPGGLALANLRHIDLSGLDPCLAEAGITVLCDVNNPLCGPNGAAPIYGPQKGASEEEVRLLDAALNRYAGVAARATGRDCREVPGAGAAGGIAFGLMSFLGAELRPGIEAVLGAIGFAAKLESADLVLTAEGAIDTQTCFGKALAGVAGAAGAARGGAGVPVIAFGGAVRVSGDQLARLGIVAALPLPDSPLTLDESMRTAPVLLANATERALRLWNAGRNLSNEPQALARG